MKERICGALQILFRNKIKVEKKHFHYNFGSMDSSYLEVAAKMIEEKKLKVHLEKHNFDKKEIYDGFEIIDARRTKGKLVYEIYKD